MSKKNEKKAVREKKERKARAQDAVRAVLDREELLKTLKVSLDFIQKGALPVLQHIRFAAKGDVCRISATDLESAWTKEMPSRGGDIDRLIPADIFYKEVKALGSDVGEVELAFQEASVSVNKRCEIFTAGSADFPELPKVSGSEYKVDGLPVLCSRVVVAASTDQSRYNINSVFFDLKRGKLVATDGHRLHYEAVEKAEPSFSLSREAVALMVKHSCADEFTLGKEALAVGLGGGLMLTRLKGQDYPDYERFLVNENPVKVAFRAGDLLKVLEGAMPMVDANSSAKGVNLAINGRLVIRSQSPGLGNYKWHISCTAEGKKEKELVIGVNAKYLVDAVRSFASDNVVLEVKDPLSPFLVNKKALIMPMRVVQ